MDKMDKKCMFCGEICTLEEQVSPWESVIRIYVNCEHCLISFMANFDREIWKKIKRVHALAQLGK